MRGFSLLEVLIATTLLTVGIVAISQVFSVGIFASATDVEAVPSWDFADYMFYFGGGTGSSSYSIGTNSNFDGSIFVNGNLTIGKNSEVDGDVVAAGTITLGNGVTVTGSVFPNADPPATQPTLDTTSYDAEITTASGESSGNETFSGTISGTAYVDGKATINGDISGTGTIVATGNIIVNSNIEVGDNITLISGNKLTANSGYLIGDNCTLYASTKVTLGNGGTFGSSDAGSVIITPDDVQINKNNEVYGLVFAADKVKLVKNSEITGNIAGGEINSIASGTEYTLDNDLVDFLSIEGFSGGSSGETVTITPGPWAEN